MGGLFIMLIPRARNNFRKLFDIIISEFAFRVVVVKAKEWWLLFSLTKITLFFHSCIMEFFKFI